MRALYSFTLSLLLLPSISVATTLHAVVTLESLKQMKPHTQGGNQLYVSSFESCSLKAKQCSFPSSPPLHWQFLKNANPTKTWLWQGKFNEGDAIKVNFIIDEKGFRPFHPTQMIGEMTLELKDVHDKLEAHWINGKATSHTPLDTTTTQFRFSDNGGNYGVYDMIVKINVD